MQTCEKIPAVPATPAPRLHRELGLFEAISANMLEMIGVGLSEAYGPKRLGTLMSFLFIWETIFLGYLEN